MERFQKLISTREFSSSSPCCHAYLRAYCFNLCSRHVRVMENLTFPEQQGYNTTAITGTRPVAAWVRVYLGHVTMPAPINSFRNSISLSMLSSKIAWAFPKKFSSRGHFNNAFSSGLNGVRTGVIFSPFSINYPIANKRIQIIDNYFTLCLWALYTFAYINKRYQTTRKIFCTNPF